MSDDWLNDLGLEEAEEVEEVEEVEEPKPRASKKKAKKKAARKPAAEPEPTPTPAPKASKKKVSKKKAARKPAPEPEEVGEVEEVSAPAPAPKPRKTRKKRAVKAAVEGDVLAELDNELKSLAAESGNTAEIDRLKAEIRSGKKLATQLAKFATKVNKAAENQAALVEKLEDRLVKLEG